VKTSASKTWFSLVVIGLLWFPLVSLVSIGLFSLVFIGFQWFSLGLSGFHGMRTKENQSKPMNPMKTNENQ